MASVSSRGTGSSAPYNPPSLSARIARTIRDFFRAGRPANKVSHRGASVAKANIVIATQNGFMEESVAFASAGIWVINSAPLECNIGETHAQFIAYTQAQVESSLLNYFDGKNVDPATTTGVFMLDMEAPVDVANGAYAHPGDLWQAPVATQDEVITAWKVRIAAAQAVLPYAKLALYGTPVPDGRGRPDNATWLSRIAALQYAGTKGLYDGLDYVSPTLFPRFGPNDGAVFYNSIDEMTEQGILGARTLKKSDGSSLPQLPLTTFDVNNGNSANNDTQILDLPVSNPVAFILKPQYDKYVELGEPTFILWAGTTTTPLLPMSNNVHGYTVNDYTRRLAALIVS